MTVDLTKKTNAFEFENRTFTSVEIDQIAQQKGLKGISFVNCPITDDDIFKICHLPKLVNVLLENTNITDKSLEYLSSLPGLAYLFITKADITGEGFKYFENNKKIDCIWACSTKLNDDNLKFLAKIPKLGTLVINDTLVTFEGLLAIADNPRIHIGTNIFTKEQIELFEQEQRKLAKGKGKTIESEIETAKERLVAFFNAMNKWEKYASNTFALTNKFADDLKEKCIEIFNIYCIDKPRNGYRPTGIHFANEPNFTYSQEKLVDVEQVSKNKIIFYTTNHINFQYRYILIKKDTVWKIDERQRKSGGWKKEGL